MKSPMNLTKKCLACMSMIALISCAAPKNADAPLKKPSDSLTGGKVLVEDKTGKTAAGTKSEIDEFEVAVGPKKTLTAEFNGNVCTLDAEAGTVAYNRELDETSLLFLMPSDLIGMPVSLHCMDTKTAVVSSHSIAVANKGFGGTEKSENLDILGDDAFRIRTFYTPVDKKTGTPESENIASAVSGDMLFVLKKNYATGVCDMVVVNLQTLKDRVFEWGEAFPNGAVMVSYNGIVFAAGEAHKGEPYLIVAKMGSTLEGSIFTAEDDLLGKVSFEEQKDDLMTVIGKDKIKIQMKISKKDVSSETTACFASEKDSSFDCVVVGSVL